MRTGDASSRSALDEEAGDGLLRVRFAGASGKLEDLTCVERILDTQRFVDRHALHG
jgi:hypothetical protein